ncbi:MAG: c-type cytochrome [Acidimicrobiia bacterium]
MTLRTLLILINVAAVLAIIVIVGAKVLSVRREPTEKTAPNQTPFYDDDVMEDAHLTRVLRWALLFSTIVAVVLPLYWLLEPSRQGEESAGFDKRAEERGATLFANPSMPAFDSAKSLQCANCHGTDASGGAKDFVLTPEAQGDPKANPVKEIWVAPSLNDVFYRFNECTPEELTAKTANCTSRAEQQVTQIITYGRPGTPMPAWGVAGGGPKNEQAVSDLVAYLKSIQITPAKARAQAEKKIAAFKTFVKGEEGKASTALATAQENLKNAKTDAQKQLYQGQVNAYQEGIKRSQDYAAEVAKMSEGELLFNTQCARCHTKGWSTLEPSNGFVPMPSPPGSGAFGPALRDGATTDQFPGDTGKQKQYDWISVGVEANKGFGVRGISSGRMPHFGSILTKKQIDAIIEFERSL